ncbi:MAG: M28 family peptidase, partial [Pseudorhodoplanes sp.]
MKDDASVKNVQTHVRHITKNIPSRLAGSENGRRMAEYSCASLNDAGIPARVIELPGLVSFPEAGRVDVLSGVDWSIEAWTSGHSCPTGQNGITGTLIDLGSGAFADYQGHDVRGKIVLLELSYSPARQEKQRIAALKGAIGCVMMNWGHPENEALPFGSVKPAWGNPTPDTLKNEMPTLPCVGISRKDGLKLRDMLRQHSLEVRVQANVENGWRPVHLTTGEISSPRSDDFVLFGGHQDSWPGEQATDNAAGSSCVLEIARAINARRDELERGVVIGLWPGHETGT